jgi:hypothetical protein
MCLFAYLNVSIWHNLSLRSNIQLIAENTEIIGKGGSVEEKLRYNSQHAAKFEFSFPFLYVYLFKNCPQFLSHRESAEPVF